MQNVLSLFDGISVAQLVLHNIGFKIDNYYASEICNSAITVTKHHFPNTIHLGDVRDIDGTKLKDIQLICGGSPCTDFSLMGHQKGMVTTENHIVDTLEKYLKLKSEGFQFEGSSYLFWEFVRLYKETNAKYFFMENVRMTKKWENIITNALGVKPIFINSSLVSAQNRERLYWTNIPCNTDIQDKNIMLSDIIPNAIAGAGKRGRKLMGDKHYSYPITVRKDGKANCLVTKISNTGYYLTKDNQYLPLNVEEMELLQTIDKGYTNVGNISNNKRITLIGNSWTAKIIEHLFNGLVSQKV